MFPVRDINFYGNMGMLSFEVLEPLSRVEIQRFIQFG